MVFADTLDKLTTPVSVAFTVKVPLVKEFLMVAPVTAAFTVRSPAPVTVKESVGRATVAVTAVADAILRVNVSSVCAPLVVVRVPFTTTVAAIFSPTVVAAAASKAMAEALAALMVEDLMSPTVKVPVTVASALTLLPPAAVTVAAPEKANAEPVRFKVLPDTLVASIAKSELAVHL